MVHGIATCGEDVKGYIACLAATPDLQQHALLLQTLLKLAPL